ncbi:PAS domain-containing protein, partial [Methylobacterium trifolii]|uniref:PAS domain-containing protein n=1 Tax=Methylobacterium trifolii TaxID=1003092 RepID=UPI001EDCBE72
MSINVIDGFSEDSTRLHAALEASCVVGVWDWDHVRGVVVYDEGAARLLTGDPDFTECEVSGPAAMAAVHPADQDWLIEHVQQAVRKGGLMLSEYRVMTRDGGTRWLLSRGRTYQDATGHPLRSNGILIDITELREGGDRYVLSNSAASDDPLEQAADLAIALKQTLGADAPSEVRLAADL